jgi:starch synthase
MPPRKSIPPVATKPAAGAPPPSAPAAEPATERSGAQKKGTRLAGAAEADKLEGKSSRKSTSKSPSPSLPSKLASIAAPKASAARIARAAAAMKGATPVTTEVLAGMLAAPKASVSPTKRPAQNAVKAAPTPSAAAKPSTVPKAAAPKASAAAKPSPAPKAAAPKPPVAPKAAAPPKATPKPKRAPKAVLPPAVRGSDGRYLRSKPHEALVSREGRAVSVVHLTAELAPIARTGGLGEVVASLSAYQAAAGMNVAIVMPLYRQIRQQFPDIEPIGDPFVTYVNYRAHGAQLYRLPDADAAAVIGMRGGATPPSVYFIDNRDFFDRDGIYADDRVGTYTDSARRYAFFCAAAMQILPRIAPAPVLLHAHDWHAALALAYLRTWYAGSSYHCDVSSVITVHNAAYQGHYSPDTLIDVGLSPSLYNFTQFEWYGRVNLLKGGMAFADAVTTVSPTHAEELRTPEGGFGLHENFQLKGDRFVGILNGIDQTRWDPMNDPYIAAPYSREDLVNKAACREALQRELGLAVRADVPIFVMTARLVQQKGLDLILENPWIFNADAQWVFLGNGDRNFVDGLRALAARHPERVYVNTTFSDALEHRMMAGGDVLLMPCRYEPCGLTQMRAQRYGTVPLVRRVGGLADTVHDGITGFVFNEFTAGAFAEAIARAIVLYRDQPQWTRMMRDGMARDFGWERSEERYRDLYRTVLLAR